MKYSDRGAKINTQYELLPLFFDKALINIISTTETLFNYGVCLLFIKLLLIVNGVLWDEAA